MAYNSVNGESDDELMLAIRIKLDQIVTKEVCDAVYESNVSDVHDKSADELDQECKARKGAIMSVISSSVCLERLYFVLRSSVMGAITGLLTYALISIFLITNFFALVVLGVFAFFVSLLISRFFDGPIVKFCTFILKNLERYPRVRSFILSRI